jgi:hypothetical protein
MDELGARVVFTTLGPLCLPRPVQSGGQRRHQETLLASLGTFEGEFGRLELQITIEAEVMAQAAWGATDRERVVRARLEARPPSAFQDDPDYLDHVSVLTDLFFEILSNQVEHQVRETEQVSPTESGPFFLFSTN